LCGVEHAFLAGTMEDMYQRHVSIGPGVGCLSSRGLSRPSPSLSLLHGSLQTVRIADDAALDDNEGMTEEEVEQLHRRKLGKAQATILEMVGDIADADAAPAENVLFVCKLNPVTTAEDLEIIFSRFGKIATCHIVTDWKTKESLQYGFVEFEKTESAEEAYVVPLCSGVGASSHTFKIDAPIVGARATY
jgi:hypothetical protein